MMEHVERITVAFESIARSLSLLTNFPISVALEGAAPETVEPCQCVAKCTAEPPAPADTNPVPYKDMDRTAIVALCEERGIEVKPHVRTDTLVGLLNTWDVKSAAEPAPAEEPAPAAEPDPFAVKPPEEADVRRALLKVQEDHGNEKVIEILTAHGAEYLTALDTDKYAAVIAAAEAV